MLTSRYKHVMKLFGARLKKARREANFKSAQKAAEVLGLEPHTYRKYERGDAEPNFELLVRMCNLYKVSTAYVLPTDADQQLLLEHSPPPNGGSKAARAAPKGGKAPAAAA
jgi:transcriptional regulator with XRE-family HTH domain